MVGGRKLATLRQEWNAEDNKDTVIFHCFPRAAYAPSGSPFVIKLETFLRLHNIKYKCDFEAPSHPETGKCPWITYNSEDVADTQIIMEFLAEKLNLTLKNDLSKTQDKVFARGIRSVLEDHYCFCGTTENFVYGKVENVLKTMPPMVPIKAVQKLLAKQLMKHIGAQAKAQGVGKLPLKSVEKMAKEDLELVSEALGDKPFMMGDEPTELDCTVFGFLVATYCGYPEECSARKEAESMESLKAYYARMKERLWSDFDDICKEVQEAAAKKEEPKKAKKGEEEEEAKEDKDKDKEEPKENGENGAATEADAAKKEDGEAKPAAGTEETKKDDDKGGEEKKDEEKKE